MASFRLAPPGAYKVEFAGGDDAWVITDIVLFGRTCVESAWKVGRVPGHVGGMDPHLANWTFHELGTFGSRDDALVVAEQWILRHRELNAWWVPANDD